MNHDTQQVLGAESLDLLASTVGESESMALFTLFIKCLALR